MKRIASLFFLLIFRIYNIHAQLPDYAGTFQDAQIVQQAMDIWGGQYFVGVSCGMNVNLTGTSFSNNTADSRGLVIKYNPDKTINWVKRFLNGGSNSISSIQINSNNQLWISGSYKDSIELDGVWYYNIGFNAFYVARLDPLTGDILQLDMASSTNDVHVKGLIFTSSGNYILSGMFKGDFYFKGQYFSASSGYNEIFIIKTNVAGGIIWSQIIEGGHDNFLDNTIRTDLHMNMYFVIRSNSFQIKINGNYYTSMQLQGSGYFFLVKMDPQSNVSWVLSPQCNYGQITTLEPDDKGNCYFGGSHSGQAQYGSIFVNMIGVSMRVVIGKIDSSGNYIWVKSYENQTQSIVSNQLHYLMDIKCSSEGSVYFAGGIHDSITIGSHIISPGNGNGGDIFSFLAKADSSGNVEWVSYTSGSGVSWPTNIYVKDSNNISLLGVLGDVQNWNQFTLLPAPPNGGGNTYWISINSKANRVGGTVYLDQNGNGVKDIGDILIAGLPVSILPSPSFSFTTTHGQYGQWVLNGNYQTIAPVLFPLYLNPTVQPQSVYFSGTNQFDTTGTISYVPNGSVDDLAVHSTLVGGRLCFLMNSYFQIHYENLGNTMQSPLITFVIDTGCHLVQSNPPPSQISGNILMWNITDLNPLTSGVIILELKNNNNSAPSGLNYIFSASIYGNPNDQSQSDNLDIDSFPINCSYDPNYKTVLPQYLDPFELAASPWLNYSIHFQNTGTGPAINVMLRDTLSENLDLSTLHIVASSHPYLFSLDANHVGKFWFHEIMLPDSGSDFMGSMGYVKYRVKAKTNLVSGDSIPNNADIFFDYNEPVRTNNATTHIIWPVSTEKYVIPSLINIYPNPIQSGEFNIEWEKQSESVQLEFYSSQGQLILSKKLNKKLEEHKFSIKGLELSAGIYFCKLMDENICHNFRIIVSP